MAFRYLDKDGAISFWTNIKNYILSKIPTKTSELTNDSGFLTSHQSLSNYVTLNSTQTIAGTKTFSSTISGSISGNAGTATQFSANTTVALTGDATGTSAGSKKGWSVPVTLANSGVTAGTYGPSADVTGNNNATISVPEITVDAKGRVTSVTNRTLTCKNNTYNVYNKTLTIQKNGTNVATFTSNSNTNVTANITVPTKVSELTNDSGYLTAHQSLSSCVKNVVTNNQTIKSTGITRGTAPSSAQTFGIAFSDNNNKSIGNIYGTFATDMSTYVGLYAYKGSTTLNSDNVSVRVGYDASGNAYTYAPTPATTDNSTQIATTAFVKAQGYLTSHQSLANYLTKKTNVSEMGRYIDLHYDNATSKYDYDARLFVDSQGTAAGGGSFKIDAASAYAPAPASNANDTRIATTAWVNSKGYLTSHPSITLSTNTTSTASPAHGGTFTCIDSVTQDTNGHITKVNTKTITLPADNNTDTKVTQTVTTDNSGYPVLLCATANATETGTTTSRFSAGLTVNTRYSSIYMSNKYDTANTKGVRNTASYSNGILYFRSYDDTQMGLIRCDSHKSGYQHIYMQASNYIKNGAISPEGTATTCSIAVRVRDNGSRTIYTDGSWENSLTPYANNTYSLGTQNLKWKDVYANNYYKGTTAFGDIVTHNASEFLTSADLLPIGSYIQFAGSQAPDGFLVCNGGEISRTTYSALFAVIGTTYGSGDGSTTFNLPNLTDRFLQGSSISGTVKDAGLPNITGHIAPNVTFYKFGSPASGSFQNLDANNPYNSKGAYISGDARGDFGYDFYASRSNSIYGNSSTVQPPALTCLICIKY